MCMFLSLSKANWLTSAHTLILLTQIVGRCALLQSENWNSTGGVTTDVGGLINALY